MLEKFKKQQHETVVPQSQGTGKHAISPEQRERQRKASSNFDNAKDLTELDQYLQKISLDDLILLRKDRKSSKNLEGGPMISGRLANSG